MGLSVGESRGQCLTSTRAAPRSHATRTGRRGATHRASRRNEPAARLLPPARCDVGRDAASCAHCAGSTSTLRVRCSSSSARSLKTKTASSSRRTRRRTRAATPTRRWNGGSPPAAPRSVARACDLDPTDCGPRRLRVLTRSDQSNTVATELRHACVLRPSQRGRAQRRAAPRSSPLRRDDPACRRQRRPNGERTAGPRQRRYDARRLRPLRRGVRQRCRGAPRFAARPRWSACVVP